MKFTITLDTDLTRRQRRIMAGSLALAAALSAGVAVALPKTFAAGEVLKAADLNANFGELEQRITSLEAPRTRIVADEGGVATVAATSAFTRVNFNATEDDLGEWDQAQSRFVPEMAGSYLVCASVFAALGSNAHVELDLFVNDERYLGFSASQQVAATTAIPGCTIASLDAGDVVEIRVFQNQGSPLDLLSSLDWHWLRINRL